MKAFFLIIENVGHNWKKIKFEMFSASIRGFDQTLYFYFYKFMLILIIKLILISHLIYMI